AGGGRGIGRIRSISAETRDGGALEEASPIGGVRAHQVAHQRRIVEGIEVKVRERDEGAAAVPHRRRRRRRPSSSARARLEQQAADEHSERTESSGRAAQPAKHWHRAFSFCLLRFSSRSY